MTRIGAAALALLSLGLATGAQAQSGALMTPERLAFNALDACWEANKHTDPDRYAQAAGFTRMPGANFPYYYRPVGRVVAILSIGLDPNDRGEPEPACRITFLKPNLDTPWTPRGPIMDAASVVERMVSTTTSWASPYRLVSRRQPHPTRIGRSRTLLRREDGQWAYVLYVEEGPEAIEILWAGGSPRVINDPGLPDFGTEPAGRQAAQAFVNDRWQIAFCELNPHTCETPAQSAARARAQTAPPQSSGNWSLPFSGIGSTASGDNRSAEQRARDESWWRNYHNTGRGRFD